MKASPSERRGVLLGELSWLEAERILGPDSLVVLPLGAAAKEHGPHLTLANDLLLAEYFTRRVLETEDIVVAPTLAYHYYPAFREYAGSTSLEFATARDMVADVCRSLARPGPRRFYVLNTGLSTMRPLAASREILASDGLLLAYTDITDLSKLEDSIAEQEGGTHADELETSMMLYIAPEKVDMSKAVSDYHPRGESGLSPDPETRKTWSASGVFGDATLATVEKGRLVVEARVGRIREDLARLRDEPLPQAPRRPSGAGGPGG